MLPLATLFARPLVKYSAIALAVVLVVVGFKLWLGAHDRAVRAEYLVELQERARAESAKATTNADKASAERKVITDETQDRIANSSSVDELFDGLRGQGGTK